MVKNTSSLKNDTTSDFRTKLNFHFFNKIQQILLNYYFINFLAEDSEEADTKARREDVLNQLLVLLNTSLKEKKLEFEILGEQKQEAGREDDIEYIVGSLGLVPPTDDEE